MSPIHSTLDDVTHKVKTEDLPEIVGIQGPPGADGYTPIKGVDYFDGDPGQQGPPGADSVVPGPPGSTTWAGITDKPAAFAPEAHAHAAADITGTAVVTNDARLSDARTPLTHSHPYEPENANIQTHVVAAHAPATAQANADITKAEIEAKLTGEISSHSHAGGGGRSVDVCDSWVGLPHILRDGGTSHWLGIYPSPQ